MPEAIPLLTAGLGALGGSGGSQTQSFQSFPGSRFISEDLGDALRFQFGRQQGGDLRKRNPNVFKGNQFIQDTIEGKFLDPFSNPGLQSALDRGADFIQNRVNSDFAGAGRNLDAGAPAGANALSDLTSRLLLPLFESGLNRQAQILNAVPTFDPLNIAINQFSNLGAGGVGQSTVPLQGDPIAGAAGGLGLGQGIQSILFPPAQPQAPSGGGGFGAGGGFG
jgi:hypothetical protein